MRKLLFVSLAVLMISALIFGACASQPAPTVAPTTAPTTAAPTTGPAPTGPAPTTASPTVKPTATTAPAPGKIVLKAVSFQPMMAPETKMFQKLVDVLNGAQSKVAIQIIGGPEVIPGLDQAQAVKRGVIDISDLPVTYYEGLVPITKFVLLSSKTLGIDEYNKGLIAELRKVHDAAGIYLFGRTDVRTDTQFVLGLKNPVTKPSELKGLKMGVSGVWYESISPKLGTTMVLIPLPESYTSVERGVVNGYSVPYNTFVTFGLQEVLKNYIDYPIYRDNKVMIVNPDKWTSLPQDARQAMEKAYLDFFPQITTDYNAINAAGKETIGKAGGKFIKFSDEDAKWFTDTSWQAMWDDFAKKFPTDAAKFLPLMGAK